MATRFEKFSGTDEAGKIEFDQVESVRVSQASRNDAKPVSVNGRLETFSDEHKRLSIEKFSIQAKLTEIKCALEKERSSFFYKRPKSTGRDWSIYKGTLPFEENRTKLVDRLRDIERRMAAIGESARKEDANRRLQEERNVNADRPFMRYLEKMIAEQSKTNELLAALIERLGSPANP